MYMKRREKYRENSAKHDMSQVIAHEQDTHIKKTVQIDLINLSF